jgi:hypothetical protein
MLAGIEQHLEPLGVEAYDDVGAMGDHRDADTAADGAPLA